MIEVLFGIIMGLGIAIFFPDTFKRIKDKLLSIIHSDHDCKK